MQDKLYGFSCRLLGNSEDARDAVQEIYVKLWKLKSKLNNYKNLEAFAMTMTRNHCIDRIRARRTVSIEDQFSRTDRLADRGADEIVHAAEAAMLVRKIINELPEKQKTVIHLRDVEGYEYEEIGSILDLSVNNVRVILSRARKKVRDELITKFYNHENSGDKTSVEKIL